MSKTYWRWMVQQRLQELAWLKEMNHAYGASNRCSLLYGSAQAVQALAIRASGPFATSSDAS